MPWDPASHTRSGDDVPAPARCRHTVLLKHCAAALGTGPRTARLTEVALRGVAPRTLTTAQRAVESLLQARLQREPRLTTGHRRVQPGLRPGYSGTSCWSAARPAGQVLVTAWQLPAARFAANAGLAATGPACLGREPAASHDGTPGSGDPERPDIARRAGQTPDHEADRADSEPHAPGRAPCLRPSAGTPDGHLARLPGQRRVRQPVQVDAGQILKERVNLAHGLRHERAVKPLAELFSRQPTGRVVFSEQRRRPVPVSVGSTDIRVICHCAPLPL